MERGPTGTKNPVSFVDEPCFAFVPHALPPKPPLQWDGSLHRMVQRAGVALGRLSGVTGLLPDPQLFLYSYVRKEAVLSSQIEGTQSSLSELLLFENDAATGAPLDDVTEVSNYVAAMEHGTKRLAEGFPLSLRLIKTRLEPPQLRPYSRTLAARLPPSRTSSGTVYRPTPQAVN